MTRTEVLQEFDLTATRRYRRQNMAKAMGAKIERALVELITNSDDSYRDLEETGLRVSGKIRVEVERKRRSSSSLVRVLDRASGMTGDEMHKKLGIVGERTSGFEEGKSRRGLYGRGAKDVVIFGPTHFESIKDDRYSHLLIMPSLKCQFREYQEVVTATERHRLGIPRGNGTVVTIEVGSGTRIPQHEKLRDILSRYYSLRDIMSSQNRDITLVDQNSGKSDPLIYEYPEGRTVLSTDITIPGYPDAKAYVAIRRHETGFQPDTLPLREGILVKSGAAIHDCTHFRLEPDIYCWRFTGEVRCDYIDRLIREYDDREERSDNPIHPTNNPVLLLDPNRDGLDENHPFAAALSRTCRRLLLDLMEELKKLEAPPKKKVSDEHLDKKLDSLSKVISKLFEIKLKELEEDVETTSEPQGTIANLPIGLHIIPPDEERIIANVPKVFTVKVIGYDALTESLPITVSSSNQDVAVRLSPVYLRRFSEDRKVGTATFSLESEVVGAESLVDVKYAGYNNVLLVSVVEPPLPPELPLGLSFDKTTYHLRVNKEKMLYLWLRVEKNTVDDYRAKIICNRHEIAVKGGGQCSLKKTSDLNVFMGKCRVIGRRSKVKGTVSATIDGFQPAYANLIVEDKEPKSHIQLRFLPDEDDFGSVRYKWDDENPYVLKIAAKHPSIRQYLGTPEGEHYPGINSPLYHGVLAEVVAEALAFNILERQFRTEGQQGMLDYTTVDANFHKHYSDFLAICHRQLNPFVDVLARQIKLPEVS